MSELEMLKAYYDKEYKPYLKVDFNEVEFDVLKSMANGTGYKIFVFHTEWREFKQELKKLFNELFKSRKDV